MAAEEVLDVGEDQLLVLLLVLRPSTTRARTSSRMPRSSASSIRVVDVPAIARDLVERRARQQAARGARMTRADGLVIRVEEVVERRFERRPRSSTNVSKNQDVWARCHLVGLASGIDCTWQSSAESGSARRSV